jgi:hypothetical protein
MKILTRLDFERKGNLQLLKMLPSGIERHNSKWNELCKKTSKEVRQAFSLDVFL